MYEAFADWNYNDDLRLVSKLKKDVVIHDKADMFNHVFRMIFEQKVKTVQGFEIEVLSDAFVFRVIFQML
ncbi:LamB/YcsF family protein [Algibacter sp. L4_22]|uniref:LamB/YcsF family protein n=1 Tax=Algibacter sp. L4_22 TaxID=2942477 RepID=UPI0034D34B03